jgi:cytochrome c-type biogenesis protein CcmH/NrfF
MLPAIYAQTLAIWTFPVLIAVMAGTWLEARARHVRG